MKGRMFSFITCPNWNVLGGSCHYICYGGGCWAKLLIKKHKMQKYSGDLPYLIEKEMRRKFVAGDFVFICDMVDWLGEWVPAGLIEPIVMTVALNKQAKFLSLTKNPERYLTLVANLNLQYGVKNMVYGATIESNLDYPTLSKAPRQINRLAAMILLREMLPDAELMVSIEPVLDFNMQFVSALRRIKPQIVAVGYDNYGSNLPEPTLEKTNKLIEEIEKFTKVYRKTLREKHEERANI